MQEQPKVAEKLSPWWRNAVIIILVVGFSVLIWVTARSYVDAPPIPGKVLGPNGETVFTRDDILAGQQVFLKYGLMENAPCGGTVRTWGRISQPSICTRSFSTLATPSPGNATIAPWQS
jgi:nitric oxide reductase subunit B